MLYPTVAYPVSGNEIPFNHIEKVGLHAVVPSTPHFLSTDWHSPYLYNLVTCGGQHWTAYFRGESKSWVVIFLRPWILNNGKTHWAIPTISSIEMRLKLCPVLVLPIQCNTSVICVSMCSLIDFNSCLYFQHYILKGEHSLHSSAAPVRLSPDRCDSVVQFSTKISSVVG